MLEGVDAAGDGPRLARPVDAPAAALSVERFAERQVGLEQIERLQRRRLIEDVTGRVGDVGGTCVGARIGCSGPILVWRSHPVSIVAIGGGSECETAWGESIHGE